MPADVEVKALVSRRARNAADVIGIGFQNEDIDIVFRKRIASR